MPLPMGRRHNEDQLSLERKEYLSSLAAKTQYTSAISVFVASSVYALTAVRLIEYTNVVLAASFYSST